MTIWIKIARPQAVMCQKHCTMILPKPPCVNLYHCPELYHWLAACAQSWLDIVTSQREENIIRWEDPIRKSRFEFHLSWITLASKSDFFDILDKIIDHWLTEMDRIIIISFYNILTSFAAENILMWNVSIKDLLFAEGVDDDLVQSVMTTLCRMG